MGLFDKIKEPVFLKEERSFTAAPTFRNAAALLRFSEDRLYILNK